MKDSPARKEKKRIGRIIARLAEEIAVSHVHAKPNKEYVVPRRFRYFCELRLRDIPHEHAFCQYNYRRKQRGLEPRTLEEYHFLKREMLSEKALHDIFLSYYDLRTHEWKDKEGFAKYWKIASPKRAEMLEKWIELKGVKLTLIR